MAKVQLLSSYICFDSFSKLKKHLGNPRQGYAWHHIVEQSQIGKRANFAPEMIHNIHNIVSIPSGRDTIHARISSYYSSKQDFTDGMIVRDWLATKKYDFQFSFGKEILEGYGKLISTDNGWIFKSF